MFTYIFLYLLCLFIVWWTYSGYSVYLFMYYIFRRFRRWRKRWRCRASYSHCIGWTIPQHRKIVFPLHHHRTSFESPDVENGKQDNH